jgi:hypothetical protein
MASTHDLARNAFVTGQTVADGGLYMARPAGPEKGRGEHPSEARAWQTGGAFSPERKHPCTGRRS